MTGESTPSRIGAPPGCDRQAGRTDPAKILIAGLAAASPDYLEGALDNPALGPAAILQLLRNPRTGASILTRLIERTRTGRAREAREIRVALVSHPGTPGPDALRLLALLGWRDQLKVADQPRTPPSVKRQAERLVAERLEGLSLGETITLARLAPRGLLTALRRNRNPRVLEASLGNPRMVEADVLTLLGDTRLSPDALSAIARQGRWNTFPAVIRKLVMNPSTPPADALRCLQRLPLNDRRRIAKDPESPKLIRLAAGRSLNTGDRTMPRGRCSLTGFPAIP